LCDCTCNIPPPWEHSPRELACILGKNISANEKEEIRGFKIKKILAIEKEEIRGFKKEKLFL
jgi:hypothetical protein